MKSKTIKIVTIVASLAVFILSLTQDAIKIDHIEIITIPAVNYFFMGSTAFLGGAVLEWIIWLANPLSLYAIILLIKNNRKAIKFSVTALLLSASFVTWNKILANEAGTMAKILSFESGYYLWVLSIIVLTIGIYNYFESEDIKPAAGEKTA